MSFGQEFRDRYDVAVLDVSMRGELNATEVTGRASPFGPSIQVIKLCRGSNSEVWSRITKRH